MDLFKAQMAVKDIHIQKANDQAIEKELQQWKKKLVQ